MNEETEYTHDSYVIVGFHRVHCGGATKLFGSPLDQHPEIVELSIRRAEQSDAYGEARYRGISELIRVRLSAAQFATLLTTMNVGDGTPATMIRLRENGKLRSVDDPPDLPSDVECAAEYFEENAAKLSSEIHGYKGEIEELLSGRVGAADKKRIKEMLRRIFQEVESNQPFYLDQFRRAAERTVTSIKAEADAFISGAITRLGLRRLSELKTLEAPESKDEL